MPRDAFRIAFHAAMSAESSDTGEIMLYGEIVQDYPKWLKEQYPNDQSAVDFDKAVKALKSQGAKKLLLRINSPGGIVTEAVAMRACLTGAGFEDIRIRIEGLCASAATIIASIPGAKVSIAPGSEYMIHNPWTIAWGYASELEKEAEHLHQLEAASRGFYMQKSGQSEEQIKTWMDEETWFNAEDAVKYGFCDELAEEAGAAMPAAACVSGREMTVMKGIYRTVPENIAEKDEPEEPEQTTISQDDLLNPHKPRFPTGEMTEPAECADNTPVSNAAPVAGAATEIHHEEERTTMEIKDINVDQLRAENPALLEQIQQAAIAADRQRQEDIDALTPPVAEYQAMAEAAKRNGTSAMDFHRQIVAAQKQKGAAHQAARAAETAPAQSVTGGATVDDQTKEESDIKAYAQEVAGYAKAYRGSTDGGMF